MTKNPLCKECGQTRIYIYDSGHDDWVRDHAGYRSPMCPYCHEHPAMQKIGPNPYDEIFTTCFCCGEDRKRIQNHHISYDPETVKPACQECHERIHHDESFRPDLTPDLSREEAIEQGYIEPGRSEVTPGEI